MKTISKYILSYVLTLNACICFAQNAKIDSLKKVLLTAKEDTNKVNVLNGLAWEYKFLNPDSSLLLINKAIALARKIGFEKGKANALRNTGGYYLDRADYRNA